MMEEERDVGDVGLNNLPAGFAVSNAAVTNTEEGPLAKAAVDVNKVVENQTALEARYSALESLYDDLLIKAQEGSKGLKASNTDLKECRQDVEALNAENKELLSKNDDLTEKLDASKERVTSLEMEKRDVEKRADSLKEEKEKCEVAAQGCDEELKVSKELVTSLQGEVQTCEAAKAELNEAVNMQGMHLLYEQERNDFAAAQTAELKDLVVRQREMLDEFKASVIELQKEVDKGCWCEDIKSDVKAAVETVVDGVRAVNRWVRARSSKHGAKEEGSERTEDAHTDKTEQKPKNKFDRWLKKGYDFFGDVFKENYTHPQ